MDLEGMTGENAEPYFTLADADIVLSKWPSLIRAPFRPEISRLVGTSLSNIGASRLVP